MKVDVYQCVSCFNLQFVREGERPAGGGHHVYLDQRGWTFVGTFALVPA